MTGSQIGWSGSWRPFPRTGGGSRPETVRRPAPLRAAAAALVAGWWLAMAVPAVAQEPKRLEPADRSGTIMGLAPGRLQVRLKNSGETWLVVPAPQATVEVKGEASREMLAPKQFVQCAVELDDLGKVLQPVDKVTFPGGGTPGVSAAGLDAPDPKARRPAGKRPAGSYLVSGFIKSVDDEGIVVQIGRDRFVIPVAAEAELEVRTPNLGVATVGDDVDLEGDYLQRGQLRASSIKVELANPLQPPQKGKKRPPAAP